MPRNNSQKKYICILMIAGAAAVIFLLADICTRGGVQKKSTREETGTYKITGIKENEKRADNTPIGIIKEYRFNLNDNLDGDKSLAFYTVHQYTVVKIDGKEVYRMEPSENKRVTKTVASNWVMVPLYAKDSGKEVCVEITPVYESFRNRKVEFLVGSPMEIYRARLKKDLPELILSGLAVLIGAIFLCISIYGMVRKRKGNGLASLGLFSIMLGIWRFTDTRFTQFMDFGKTVFVYYISIINIFCRKGQNNTGNISDRNNVFMSDAVWVTVF